MSMLDRDFHRPGRSAVIATDGMAATSHPLATQAALEVLRAGGTAADAAVTAAAVLCVVEPHMTGIGGDCFCLMAEPDKPVWGYNGCGRAAAKATTEALLESGETSIASQSIHSVTVPGSIEAWGAILEAHGRFTLERALQPAIRYAELGFAVAPRVGHDWALNVDRISGDPGASKHYLINGQAPAIGTVVRLPALARTLRTIAQQGPRAFYEGPIAQDMVSTIAARGSFMTSEDFASHRGDVVEPISTRYRDVDVVEIPPNGQGIAALVLLNILENFDLKQYDPLSAERFHIQLEAARMAYAIRDTHIADPAFMRVSSGALLDKAFARRLAAHIDLAKRAKLPTAPTPGSDTVYLTVVDRDRRACSLINSLYAGFGAGIATEKTGIMLTNRGACFRVEPGHPNTIGPGKRPMHTIIPALQMRDNRCEMAFGVMGGDYQPMGQAQVMVNVQDYGMDIQSALDAPRVFYEGENTVIERGVPDDVVRGLRARGHHTVVTPLPLGGGQGICIDWKGGVLIGGSDPRKDGCALGY